MGGALFKIQQFTRNDSIVGQGKEVLIFAKQMKIAQYELNRMYNLFLTYIYFTKKAFDNEQQLLQKKKKINPFSNNNPFAPQHHLVDFDERMLSWRFLFDHCKVRFNLFHAMLFQYYDVNKTGKAHFYFFVVHLWTYLTTDEDGLATLCFSLFDVYQEGCLDIDEIRYLIHLIHDFEPSKATIKALKKIEQNRDGTFTLAEFILLSARHPVLLSPLRQSKKLLRRRLIFPRFWKQLMTKRVVEFEHRSTMEILNTNYDTEGNAINYGVLAIEYINLQRNTSVPQHFIDQYHVVQQRKQVARLAEERQDITVHHLPYDVKAAFIAQDLMITANNSSTTMLDAELQQLAQSSVYSTTSDFKNTINNNTMNKTSITSGSVRSKNTNKVSLFNAEDNVSLIGGVENTDDAGYLAL